MLLLTRKIGECIVIGNGIKVMVCEVTGTDGNRRVRLGIQAPPEVPVHRLEVAEAIARGDVREPKR